jgi:hypothetical protein
LIGELKQVEPTFQEKQVEPCASVACCCHKFIWTWKVLKDGLVTTGFMGIPFVSAMARQLIDATQPLTQLTREKIEVKFARENAQGKVELSVPFFGWRAIESKDQRGFQELTEVIFWCHLRNLMPREIIVNARS